MNHQPANDNAADLPGGWSHSNGAVLLAEDDPAMRALVAATLRRAGLAVIECSTGTELVMTARREWLTHERPVCVITEMRMPGCSGFEATEDLRLLGWAMPILMLSGRPDRRLREQAEELGATLLEKPFPLAEVRDFAVRASCAQARAF